MLSDDCGWGPACPIHLIWSKIATWINYVKDLTRRSYIKLSKVHKWVAQLCSRRGVLHGLRQQIDSYGGYSTEQRGKFGLKRQEPLGCTSAIPNRSSNRSCGCIILKTYFRLHILNKNHGKISKCLVQLKRNHSPTSDRDAHKAP